MPEEVKSEEIRILLKELEEAARVTGYFLNTDAQLVNDLLAGLLVNEKRYGYRACPCRLAQGDKSADLDIICPCDYRSDDIEEFGQCYCGLYVSESVSKKGGSVESIPERRLTASLVPSASTSTKTPVQTQALPYPIWRCRACGYLCANTHAPQICPICKAPQERFEPFAMQPNPMPEISG